MALSAIAIAILQPLDIPIWGDRAYLMYASQVIFRGEALYEATTLGYTPLAPLVAGYFMKGLAALGINVDTVLTLRCLGLFTFSFITGSLFVLAQSVFKEKKLAHLVALMFSGLGFLLYTSAANFEPKMLALACQIWGLYFVIRRKWLVAGILMAFTAMCWQPMVINCFGVALYLVFVSRKANDFFPAFGLLCLGVALGTLPSLIYIMGTDTWGDFWLQAVVRKSDQEGGVLFNKPFRWILRFILPHYKAEAAIILLGYLGTAFALVMLVRKRGLQVKAFGSTQAILLFVILFGFWALFSTMEFQGSYDGTPMLPMLLIFGAALFWQVAQRWYTPIRWSIFMSLMAIYAHFDLFMPKYAMTYSEQKAWIETLHEEWGDAFTMLFEEFYVLREEPLPTKYLRYASYDDYLIDRVEAEGCQTIIDQIGETRPKALIMFYSNAPNGSIGLCGQKIMQTYCDLEVYDSKPLNLNRDNALHSKVINKDFRIYPTNFDE